MRGCFLAPDPEPDTRQYGAGDDFSVRQGGQRLLGPVNTTRPAPPRARQPPRPAATPAPRPTPAPGHAQPPPPGSAHNPSLPLVGVLDAGLDRLTIPLMIRPCAVRASCSPSSRSWSSSRRRAASFGAQHRDPRLSSAIPLLTSLHSTTAIVGRVQVQPHDVGQPGSADEARRPPGASLSGVRRDADEPRLVPLFLPLPLDRPTRIAPPPRSTRWPARRGPSGRSGGPRCPRRVRPRGEPFT